MTDQVKATDDLLALFTAADISVAGRRYAIAYSVYTQLSELERERARICIVPYTFDTQRYGSYKLRQGRAVKIGSGGQHKGKKPYIIYLDWSEKPEESK